MRSLSIITTIIISLSASMATAESLQRSVDQLYTPCEQLKDDGEWKAARQCEDTADETAVNLLEAATESFQRKYPAEMEAAKDLVLELKGTRL